MNVQPQGALTGASHPPPAGSIGLLDLDAHWPEVDRLLTLEEWPFIRADLEVSHQQPRAFGLVAAEGASLRGLFTVHSFGEVAYLDLFIVERDDRNTSTAFELWFGIGRELKRRGFQGSVAHCTQDSGPLLRAFGYQPGATFTLLRREGRPGGGGSGGISTLDRSAVPALVALDRQVFGIPRPQWISALMEQPSTRFVGAHRGSQLVASLCLRERRGHSYCLDACNALAFEALEPLLDGVLRQHGDRRLECFVKDGSDLDHHLRGAGFEVPDFFEPIGPLVEYRDGATSPVGAGPHLRNLSWI